MGPKAFVKAFGAKPAPLPLPQRDSFLNLDEEGRQTSPQTHSQASHLLSSPTCRWSIHPKPSLRHFLKITCIFSFNTTNLWGGY